MLKILLGQLLFLIILNAVNHRYLHCSTDARKGSLHLSGGAGSCSNIALFMEDSGKQQTKSVSEHLLRRLQRIITSCWSPLNAPTPISGAGLLSLFTYKPMALKCLFAVSSLKLLPSTEIYWLILCFQELVVSRGEFGLPEGPTLLLINQWK